MIKCFLDNVTNRTIEISLGRIYDYPKPYSKFLVLASRDKNTAISISKKSAKANRTDRKA